MSAPSKVADRRFLLTIRKGGEQGRVLFSGEVTGHEFADAHAGPAKRLAILNQPVEITMLRNRYKKLHTEWTAVPQDEE